MQETDREVTVYSYLRIRGNKNRLYDKILSAINIHKFTEAYDGVQVVLGDGCSPQFRKNMIM